MNKYIYMKLTFDFPMRGVRWIQCSSVVRAGTCQGPPPRRSRRRDRR